MIPSSSSGCHCARKSQLRMKIRIQSDDDFAALAGLVENYSVIGGRKTPTPTCLESRPNSLK